MLAAIMGLLEHKIPTNRYLWLDTAAPVPGFLISYPKVYHNFDVSLRVEVCSYIDPIYYLGQGVACSQMDARRWQEEDDDEGNESLNSSFGTFLKKK